MEAALEGGAEDIATEDSIITVLCDTKQFASVLDHFDSKELQYTSAELTMLATASGASALV